MRISKFMVLASLAAFLAPFQTLPLHAETPISSSKTVEVEWKASPGTLKVSSTPTFQPVLPASSLHVDPVAPAPPKVPVVKPVLPESPGVPTARPAVPTYLPASSTVAPTVVSGSAPALTLASPNSSSVLIWGSVEYLAWWTKGMNVPPLVTTGNAVGLGTLGDPSTRILDGNERANTGPASGIRVRLGVWLDECNTCGLDGGLFGFGQMNSPFKMASTGDPNLFRPFTDTNPNAPGPNSELIALRIPNLAGGFDPILSGAVAVRNSTDFAGWDVNIRRRLFGDNCSSWRVDSLLGYRYLRLRDVTSIQENLLTTDPLERLQPINVRINVLDRFATTNIFNGAQVGLLAERWSGRWVASLRGTVALGVTQQRVNIAGSTQTILPDGTSSTLQGGLLALSSNIGSYSSSAFSVVPEVNLNIGYQVTDHIRVFGGYSFLYWSNVVRSSEQINLTVNSSLLPNNGPPLGPNNPVFQRHSTDFWAHGFNVGVMLSW